MIEELTSCYLHNGVLATGFTCTHKNECQGDCDSFTGPKSAFVSSGYEAHALPRLLFLSLDSGSGDKNDENRLPLAVRQPEEVNRNVLKLHKHKHWYRTHELAWHILAKFKRELQIQDAKNFFAHANSAKCCMNKKQRKKADAILFKNCRGYLGGELKILSPDILVTQGNEAKKAIKFLKESTTQIIDEFSSIIKLNGKHIFWLHTYHPNNWGAFNKQRDFDKTCNVSKGWVMYSDLMYEFFAKNA